jgi:L-ascorbate metabolism protein UlaG (beta-lactamase superfamily)
VIEPMLKDEAFLADVDAARACRDSFHLWWLGQSGFLAQRQGRRVLFDPYLSNSLTKKYEGTDKPHVRMTGRVIDPALLPHIDVVTGTHAHTDHLDPATLRHIDRWGPDVGLIVPEAIYQLAVARVPATFDHILGLNVSRSIRAEWPRIPELDYLAVPAVHDPPITDEQGRHRCVGFLVSIGGFNVYHAGDTLYDFSIVEALGTYPVDLALVPINGKVGNMNGADAARLAYEVGAKLVVPCHYEMFEFNTASPYELFVPECERLGQPYKVLRAGERLTLTK